MKNQNKEDIRKKKKKERKGQGRKSVQEERLTPSFIERKLTIQHKNQKE